MTDVIRPALSPEEWQEVIRFGGPMQYDSYLELLKVEVPPAQHNAVFRMMALANAVLPDGDARKFTHDDARILADTSQDISAERRRVVAMIAVRVRALLPPEWMR
jgi:hypothetical protein